MDLLTYSSADDSPLNNARRSYWMARCMLSEANKNPGKYDLSLRFWVLNMARKELRDIAHKMRAKQCAPTESN